MELRCRENITIYTVMKWSNAVVWCKEYGLDALLCLRSYCWSVVDNLFNIDNSPTNMFESRKNNYFRVYFQIEWLLRSI